MNATRNTLRLLGLPALAFASAVATWGIANAQFSGPSPGAMNGISSGCEFALGYDRVNQCDNSGGLASVTHNNTSRGNSFTLSTTTNGSAFAAVYCTSQSDGTPVHVGSNGLGAAVFMGVIPTGSTTVSCPGAYAMESWCGASGCQNN
jgi:hypothetical protein